MLNTDIGSQQLQVGLDLLEEVTKLKTAATLDRADVVEEAAEVPSQVTEENVETNEHIRREKIYLQTLDVNTKEGNPTKRKKYVFKPDERKKIKMTVLKEGHPVKSTCATT